MTSALAIRTMDRADLDVAIDWAATEGWNPGLHDAASFHAADPGGFLVGEIDGAPVATISAVRYGATFGFVGLYIVRADLRGRGHGIALWNAGLAHLAGRNVGLDGVVAQQANYRKSGFALACRNVRYEGTVTSTGTLDARIVPLSACAVADIVAYDRGCFPEERSAFVRAWIAQPEGRTLATMGQGRVTGYGVVRPCRTGYKIGPLFADDASVADALFVALQARLPAGAPIFLDVPETNPAGVALAERHGMRVSFETARMYTGPAPALPLRRIFGITTFELG